MLILQEETRKTYSLVPYPVMDDHITNRSKSSFLDQILFHHHNRSVSLLNKTSAVFLQLFNAGADVLRRIGEDGRIIQEFMELGTKAKAAASEAMDAEAALGEIPEEFLDPIQVFLLSNLIEN